MERQCIWAIGLTGKMHIQFRLTGQGENMPGRRDVSALGFGDCNGQRDGLIYVKEAGEK